MNKDLKNIDLQNLYDVIIVGGGPAGLTAALYLGRARYRVLVIEKMSLGGQISITSEVVNYPGILNTSGYEMTNTMRQQAENFGAEFLLADVQSLEVDDSIKVVNTSRGKFYSFGIIMATGAKPRKIGFPGEEEFKGRGVAYCATCDGEFFTGKQIFVVGGGYAAAEEAMFLTKYGSKVTMLVRKDKLSCAQSVIDEVNNHENLEVLYNTEVVEVKGSIAIDTLVYKNNLSDKITEFSSDDGFGLFIFAGYEPETVLVEDILDLDINGYILTDENKKTQVDGLYAAGDVCKKNLRQVVTAVSDGAIAATELEKYASKMQEETGLVPKVKEVIKPSKEETIKNNKEESSQNETSFFSEEMLKQLNVVFDKMESKIALRVLVDERPVSRELVDYMENLVSLTDKLSLEVRDSGHGYRPRVSLWDEDGNYKGLAFHGVPGGHEFTSFILGLYNASGKGQSIADEEETAIKAIDEQIVMKIVVSLSCTMCPELVVAAQKIATLNPKVRAEVYDIDHFPHFREDYNIMSVPCLIIQKGDKEELTFGKKNIGQILEFIEKI